ncbi:MAG TPA: HEAT repeat domain-containing protein, partial [Gemmataceae bacterium]|nr:HEAT repeat domain-containing protein [Gemmataceae bacterium]
ADVTRALDDHHPGVRRHAVRLSEKRLNDDAELASVVLKRAEDSDATVRLQTAYTLGEFADPRAAKALARIARRDAGDIYLLSAVFSSVNATNVDAVLSAVLEQNPDTAAREKVVRPLLGLAASLGEGKGMRRVIAEITTPREDRFATWQMSALADVLDALQRRGQELARLLDEEAKPRVGRLFAQARRDAADTRRPEAERLAAIGLLGRGLDRRGEDIEALSRLLVPQNSNAVQSAAVATLGRLSDRSAARALLVRWESHSPALRAQVLDALLGREAWLPELVDRLEKGDIKATHLDATRRARLLSHRDADVRRKAEKLLGGALSKDRAHVIDSYREALSLRGDAARGRAVYLKNCAICHRLGNDGNVVGPDLAALSDRSPQALLIAILDPNRAVEDRYVNYLAVTSDGRTFNGILAGETAASITLRNQEGKEQVLLRRDLDQLTNTGLSLMPEGMEKDLSKQDLADLMNYLANLESPKKCPGNTPTMVTADRHGQLMLLATNGEIYGKEIVFEPDFRNIGMWHGEQDRVVWRVRVAKEGRYDVHLDWACHPDSAGNAYILDNDPPLRGRVAGTGGWDRYRRQKIGAITLKAGEQALTFRPDGKLERRALLDLRGLYLVPAGSPLILDEGKTRSPK